MQSGGSCAQDTLRQTFALSSILGYWNGKILAILNLHVTTMPPIKFQGNPTYSLGGDVL